MFKSLVVGTLATLNSVMTPLSGAPKSGARDYHLSTNQECAPRRPSFVVMRVEPLSETAIAVSLRGQLCRAGGPLEPFHYSVILPADLTDTAFLAKLPLHASYVVSKIPSARPIQANSPTVGSRIKLTKGAPGSDGQTPIHIEWLPNDDRQIEHLPMTVWIQQGTAIKRVPWARIEFPELSRSGIAPLSILREFRPTVRLQ